MSLRAWLGRLAPRVVARLDAFNRRHPWSHNDHFHPWILRHLPERCGAALDVGCGRGELLARLAERFTRAHGTDIDAAMRTAATLRVAGHLNTTVDNRGLAELEGPYDAITMVAVLHHLDAPAALAECRRLLAPGGRLLIVGLTRPVSIADQMWDVICSLTNPLIGLAKHPRPATGPASGPGFPVTDPTLGHAQTRSLIRIAFPGARVRRRLGFRYTALCEAPGCCPISARCGRGARWGWCTPRA